MACGAQCVTAVDPEWLAELGPMFFSIKESHSSRLAARAQRDCDARRAHAARDAAPRQIWLVRECVSLEFRASLACAAPCQF